MTENVNPERDWRRALEEIWSRLEHIAEAVDAGSLGKASTGPVSPKSLAAELGHGDDGLRIRSFLLAPDDGGEPFPHRPHAHWLLDADAANRVRRRFACPH